MVIYHEMVRRKLSCTRTTHRKEALRKSCAKPDITRTVQDTAPSVSQTGDGNVSQLSRVKVGLDKRDLVYFHFLLSQARL